MHEERPNADRRAGDEPAAPITPAGTLDWRRLHLWQIQPVRDLLIVAALVGVVYLGYAIRLVTVPLLLALLFAYLFEPLIRRVTRRGWISRPGAVVAVIVLAGVLIVAPVTIGIGFGVVQGVNLAGGIARSTGQVISAVQAKTPEERTAARAELPGMLRRAADGLAKLRVDAERYKSFQVERTRWRTDYVSAEQLHAAAVAKSQEDGLPPPAPPPVLAQSEPVSDVPEWKSEVYDALSALVTWVQNNAQSIAKSVGEQALGTGAQAVGAALGAVASVGTIAFTGLLTAFFFFFLSTGWGQVLKFWEGLIPEKRKGRWVTLLQRMDGVIAGFIRGRLTICLILGAWITINYWWIGVPAPFILGPVVGAMFLIPYASGFSVPIVMLLMWLEPSGVAWQQNWWWIVFAPIGLQMSCQLLDDYILTPSIQGKNTDLDMPSILFASLAGGVLAGIYGLLIAIPVAACLKILLKEFFWPRFESWAKGKEEDFLPIGRE